VVLLVYGDGSFGLHGMEFEASGPPGIPVIAVIGTTTPGGRRSAATRDQLYGEERAVATALDTHYEEGSSKRAAAPRHPGWRA
jgi:acetolactate synthase-1/2/3 large subunit